MTDSRPMIVVDKCFVQGAKKGLLRELARDFRLVPTDVLLFEIGTDATRGRSLEKKVRAEMGDQCPVSAWELIEKEITEGIPGSQVLRSEGGWVCFDDFSRLWDDKFLREQEELFGDDGMRLLNMERPSDNDSAEAIRQLRRPKRVFYGGLAQFVKDRGPLIASHAKEVGAAFAEREGWKISDAFAPDDGWCTFGYYLTLRAADFQNLHRLEPTVRPKENPANYGADLHYLMWLACADGLITNESKVLSLAWAIYPEKREHLYQYDKASASLRVFDPTSPARCKKGPAEETA